MFKLTPPWDSGLSGNLKAKLTVHFSFFTEKMKMLTRNNLHALFHNLNNSKSGHL